MIDKGKLIYKHKDFIGGAKLGNKVVRDILAKDTKKVINTRTEKDAVYDKLKDFGRKGRGLTESEQKMALAELKYGTNDPISKKEANILADELGIGREKITRRVYLKAKKYKQRIHPVVKKTLGNELRAKAEQGIADRRTHRGRRAEDFRQVADRAGSSSQGHSVSGRRPVATSGVRHSINSRLSARGAGIATPRVNPHVRLMRGRSFGSSHSAASRSISRLH